ncbi:MAG: hypothetical protein K1Y02_05775 [Candidatus Hydrogenedentes bacterium]|nr:hypothetical protein [Candidatus Hydrogenedentota bacterium]
MSRNRSFQDSIAPLVVGTILALAPFLFSAPAHAVDPTSLEPAEAFTPRTLELELETAYEKYEDAELELEATVGYAFSERWKLEAALPVEYEEGDGTEVGDASLKLIHTFNPDTEKWPLLGLSLKLAFPTGDHGDEDHGGIDTELMFYAMQSLGGPDSKHQLHLNLGGTFVGGASDEERDFRYSALLGYSYALNERTTLVADFIREELEENGEDSNMLEVGVKRQVNDSVEVAAGAGIGLGEDSPDFMVKAGIGFKTGQK